MVDILVNWQKYEFNFAGESVTMELKPLETGAIFDLMGISLDSPDRKQTEIMLDIFNKYARNIENLTVNGKPATVADLAIISQLLPLCGDVMSKLTEISNLSTGEEKASEGD